jgi:hypothetical protein
MSVLTGGAAIFVGESSVSGYPSLAEDPAIRLLFGAF